MQRRVLRILLVASPYDSFILSEDGELHETLVGQFVDLRLVQVPQVVEVSSVPEALELAAGDVGFDLVIASLRTGECTAVDLVRGLRELGLELPVVALAYTSRELAAFAREHDTSQLEELFLWQGDPRLLLAIVKLVEDRHNVEADTNSMGVPVLLVVEDGVRYYSSFLPAIYGELYQHTERLLSEDLNLSQRVLRMRARPKVLFAKTFEEAWEEFTRYEEHVLGVISDFEFPRGGAKDPRAGKELCERVRAARPDVRLVMQSSREDNRPLATELGADFLVKGSAQLLHELGSLLETRFGFGAFVFREPSGREVARAHDLKSLNDVIATVSDESLVYHAERNHFANWMKARTEFGLALRLRPQRLSDFPSVDALRAFLLDQIRSTRLDRYRSVVVDFDRDSFEPMATFTRIGGGSLGGKARGAAFANRVLRESGIEAMFPEVDVVVPPSIVLGTELYDDFLRSGLHHEFALSGAPDEEIVAQFLAAPFPREAIGKLRTFLQRVRYPLAVRSSSLLEDSLSQPFAGVYETRMLANNAYELDLRWEQLSSAVKRVWASAFLAQARRYLSMTSFRLEEEKMAVMVQELVGRQHGSRFYPDFAGVARSLDSYPEPGHAPEDGVAAVALGLGTTVVGGEPCLRFCPRYPKELVGFSSVADALQGSQRTFQAVDLAGPRDLHSTAAVRHFDLSDAEEDGTLKWIGSTWLPQDDRIVDGIARPGKRLVSFAEVLKHGAFPLAPLLDVLLQRCSQGTGVPVEIEFAGNFATRTERARFAFLQLRPVSASSDLVEVDLAEVDPARVLCRSRVVLGNARIDDIEDLVIVDRDRFERSRSPEVALEVARYDARLRREEKPYLLVGVGRWGSSDRHLGIPVDWNQISGARVIVEAGLRDLRVTPSQGTHFFQNLSTYGVGYLTVNPELGDGALDWEWLLSRPALDVAEGTGMVRHVRLDRPLLVLLSARDGEGVVLRS